MLTAQEQQTILEHVDKLCRIATQYGAENQRLKTINQPVKRNRPIAYAQELAKLKDYLKEVG